MAEAHAAVGGAVSSGRAEPGHPVRDEPCTGTEGGSVLEGFVSSKMMVI